MSRRTRPARGPMGGPGGPTRRAGRAAPAEPPPRPPAELALEEAVERVARRRSDWAPEALDPGDGERVLAWIQGAAIDEGQAAGLDGWAAGERTLARRLLDLIRHDLLEREGRLPDDQMLGLLRSLERIRARVAPPPQQILATRLMGANAPELVMELAHDLRSPLTSIMFLAETLRRGQSGQVNDVQRQQLGIIYSAALSLTTVASDLIDLSREDTFLTEDAAARATLSLRDLFDSVRNMVAPMVEEKRIDLLTLTPDHDYRLGNVVSLGRVLLNLTANAIKFTEAGSVELVAQEVGGRKVEFSVRDTGRGMDAETLDRLFEPFHRSRSRTGFHFSDTGLGLTLCRRLVELMGGTLEVETRLGWGSRFYFEIEMPRGTRV
jgi:signal transduction histidine kinase